MQQVGIKWHKVINNYLISNQQCACEKIGSFSLALATCKYLSLGDGLG